MDNNGQNAVFQQLVLERVQLEGGKINLLKTIKLLEDFLKKKMNEKKLFRSLMIIGFDKEQDKEIEAIKKNLEEGNNQLVRLREELVSKERRINAIKT